MKNRSELREITVKVLYQVFVLKNTNLEYNVDDLIKELLEVESDFVEDLVNGVISNLEELKNTANDFMKDWTIDRLNLVDQAIILVGIYELKFTDTPPVVAINEAVEISKKYSDDAVVKMINATLDAIYHSKEDNER